MNEAHRTMQQCESFFFPKKFVSLDYFWPDFCFHLLLLFLLLFQKWVGRRIKLDDRDEDDADENLQGFSVRGCIGCSCNNRSYFKWRWAWKFIMSNFSPNSMTLNESKWNQLKNMTICEMKIFNKTTCTNYIRMTSSMRNLKINWCHGNCEIENPFKSQTIIMKFSHSMQKCYLNFAQSH